MTRTVLLGNLMADKGYIRGPFGSALRRPELKSEGIPVYEQQNAIYTHRTFRYFIDSQKYEELKRFTVKPGDLLISCSGTLGKITVIQPEDPVGIISQALLILRVNQEKVLPEYLYYFLSSTLGQHLLLGASHGSVQTNIAKRAVVESIKINLPSLHEQKEIVNVLGSIDEKIELNRKMNETLEQMGQAIFRHYFIDNPEAKKWEDGIIADLGEVITGKTPSKSKSEYYGGDVPFLKVPDMHGQPIVTKTEDMLSTIGADSQSKKYIPKWSTCVSCIATVGVVSLAGERIQTNQQINSIIPKCSEYTIFNYYLIKSKSDYLKTMASGGSATPNLNKGHFENIKVKLPPIELSKKFQDEAESLLNMMDKGIRENQVLTTLRDTLLPRLISGKIKMQQ